MSEAIARMTVKELVDRGVIERPMDGNHGEIHPKGEDFVSAGVPFITAADLRDGHVDVRGCAFISVKQAQSLRKGFAKLGDVLLTHKATMGRTAIVDVIPEGLDWLVLTPQVTYYRVLQPNVLDARYLKFYFDSSEFQTLLAAWSGGGSTRAYLGITKQLDLPIALPSIETQRAIAGVLGALDDKIEQNRRTARALERLARAIFRAWFVDFEPVKAKAEGATAFPSMPPQVFDALSTRFVDSGIGPVPEGWELKAIGDVVTLKGGGTPSTKSPGYWDGGVHRWATPRDMSRLSHPVLLDTERRITNAGVDSISSGLLPVGTILMSSRAPVGYLAIAGVPTAINQGFIAMICDRTLPSVYVLNWAFISMDTIRAHASGTTFPEISKKNFRPLPIVEPTGEVIVAYQQVADPLFESLTACVRENERLAEMRDYLLPRLLRGSVRVEAANG